MNSKYQMYSLCNLCVLPKDIELDHNLADTELYEMVVPPSNRSPFGWADPESGSMVLIAVGVGLKVSCCKLLSLCFLRR